jgi:putative transposase
MNRIDGMPRKARIVIPGLAHHVTQRGGRRQDVFFRDGDRQLYLRLLSQNAERYGVQILSYCLMTNHVHQLVVPMESDSLRWMLQFTHKRYADHINARENWTGHLWQQRFYSSPVDDEYFWVALRYIQRNPVEAKIVRHAADYRWSSAAGHCGLCQDPVLTRQKEWAQRLESRGDWHRWLSESDPVEKLSFLKKRTLRDLPTGAEEFLDRLEKNLGISVRPGKLGRPKRGNS